MGPQRLLLPPMSSGGVLLPNAHVPAAPSRPRAARAVAARSSNGDAGASPQQPRRQEQPQDGAPRPPRDTPDRSTRQRGQLQRVLQRSRRAGVLVPSPLPVGPADDDTVSPAAAGAAMDQLLQRVREQGGEEQAQLLWDVLDEQEDARLLAQLQDMSPDQLKEVHLQRLLLCSHAPAGWSLRWRRTIGALEAQPHGVRGVGVVCGPCARR